MARSEARLSVSIWTNADFLALAPTAQRMFMFLLSQPDLAHDGVIALRERRWSKSAAGLTRTDVENDLATLADARFVVIDEDAEELLIRSFIRRDKVYRQPNVLRAAQDHLEVVTSPAIRAAIAAELRRIVDSGELKGEAVRIVAEMLDALGDPSGKGSGNPSDNPAEGVAGSAREDHPKAPAEATETVETAGADTSGPEPTESAKPAGRNPSGNPSPNPSGNPSPGTPGERGVVTAVSTDSPFPYPRSPFPVSPGAPEALPAREPRGKRGTRLPDDFAITPEMRAWYRDKTPAVDIAIETEKFRDHWRSKSGKDAVKNDWPAAWRNWMRNAHQWKTERATSRTNGHQPFTNPTDADAYGGTL